jgi:hypothetical protein
MARDELSKVASMEAMREAWTDDRLDDLANRMDLGFDRMDKDARELRAEMKAGFDRIEDEFREVRAEMKAGFDGVRGVLYGLQRTMLQIGGGLIGTLLVVTAGVLASHL